MPLMLRSLRRKTLSLQALCMRFGRVSWERVVSGPGLMNLYVALATGAGDDSIPAPEQIVAAARSGTDRRSGLALEFFSQALGRRSRATAF